MKNLSTKPVSALIWLMLVSSSMAMAQIPAANPANPHDWIGELHNRALDVAIEESRAAFLDCETTPTIALALMQNGTDYVCANLEAGNCDSESIPTFGHIAWSVANQDEALAEIEARLNPDQAQFLRQIYQQFEKTVDVATTIEAIRKIEKQILHQLSDIEAQPILMAASIARHSASYWAHQGELGEASPWKFLPTMDPSLLSDPQGPWFVVGASDLIGGLLGAEGGPAGAAFGAFAGSALAYIAEFD